MERVWIGRPALDFADNRTSFLTTCFLISARLGRVPHNMTRISMPPNYAKGSRRLYIRPNYIGTVKEGHIVAHSQSYVVSCCDSKGIYISLAPMPPSNQPSRRPNLDGVTVSLKCISCPGEMRRNIASRSISKRHERPQLRPVFDFEMKNRTHHTNGGEPGAKKSRRVYKDKNTAKRTSHGIPTILGVNTGPRIGRPTRRRRRPSG